MIYGSPNSCFSFSLFRVIHHFRVYQMAMDLVSQWEIFCDRVANLLRTVERRCSVENCLSHSEPGKNRKSGKVLQ